MLRLYGSDIAVASFCAAVRPLRVAFAFVNGQRELCFRVYDDRGRTVLRSSGISARRLRDRFSGHCSIVGEVRELIEERGYKLAAWRPPI